MLKKTCPVLSRYPQFLFHFVKIDKTWFSIHFISTLQLHDNYDLNSNFLYKIKMAFSQMLDIRSRSNKLQYIVSRKKTRHINTKELSNTDLSNDDEVCISNISRTYYFSKREMNMFQSTIYLYCVGILEKTNIVLM